MHQDKCPRARILSSSVAISSRAHNDAHRRYRRRSHREGAKALSEDSRQQHRERGWLERATGAELRVSGALKLAAIVLIVAVGLAHLRGALPHYRFAPYIGVGFVVNFVGVLVAAVGIYRDALWGWLLGVVVAGGALVLYVVSRSVGLPGFEVAVGRWFGPLATISLIVEVPFIVLFLLAVITRRGWTNHTSLWLRLSGTAPLPL